MLERLLLSFVGVPSMFGIGNRKEKKVICYSCAYLLWQTGDHESAKKKPLHGKIPGKNLTNIVQLTIPEHCVKPADDHWYYSNGLNEIGQSCNNMSEDCADNAQLREQNWDGELTADTRGLHRLLLEMFSFRERVATRFVCCRSIHCGQRKQHCFKQFQTVKLRRIVRKSHVARSVLARETSSSKMELIGFPRHARSDPRRASVKRSLPRP